MSAPPKKPGKNDAGAFLKVDHLKALQDGIAELLAVEVLVGVPEAETDRDAEELTNAAIAYIHDRGAPEANIPARPFMIPGIDAARAEIVKALAGTARAVAISSQTKNTAKSDRGRRIRLAIEKGYHRVGLITQRSIRSKINEGIPPPLSEYTLRQRAAKGRKGAQEELKRRAQGVAPSTTLAKPLIDTGELRNAINYVIRKKKARRS